MFSDDSHNNIFQNENDMSGMASDNAAAFSPEVLSSLAGPAQYDYNKGFNDIALLADFTPSLDHHEMQPMADTVEEFIASSNAVEFNQDGHPIVAENSDSDSSIEVASLGDGE